MIDTLLVWLSLVPLDATPFAPPPVQPTRSNGFAAYIVGGFFGLGLLILAMKLITLKPKRVDPREHPQPRPRPE